VEQRSVGKRNQFVALGRCVQLLEPEFRITFSLAFVREYFLYLRIEALAKPLLQRVYELHTLEWILDVTTPEGNVAIR
jgi:hypothetical protein